MLENNLDLHSVKSHNSNSDCLDEVPRTKKCFDGRTWQLTGSTGDSVGSALPSK